MLLVVQIAPKIKIDSTPKEYKVKKGEDVNIEVKFTASPPPTDEWTVNGTVIKKNKRVCITDFICIPNLKALLPPSGFSESNLYCIYMEIKIYC